MEQNDKKITSTGKSASGVPEDYDSATTSTMEGGTATTNEVKVVATEEQIQTVFPDTLVRKHSNIL